jgi:RNA polymerase sigma-70 factor (ECF subfamily)
MEHGLNDWETIVREHGPVAFATAWRILGNESDTEDAVQDALVDALRLYREQPIKSWGALLRHLATCRALDALRKRRSQIPFDADPPASPAENPEAVAISAELATRLRWALAQLPQREAEVFSLRYFGDLTNGDIAAALALNSGAVAVALHKARSRLEELLQVEENPR